MRRNQPFAVLEFVGEGITRRDLGAVLQRKGVDARVDGIVAAEFDRPAVDFPLGMLLQEFSEVFGAFLLVRRGLFESVGRRRASAA